MGISALPKRIIKRKEKKEEKKSIKKLYICNAFIYQVKCIQIFLEIYFFYIKNYKRAFFTRLMMFFCGRWLFTYTKSLFYHRAKKSYRICIMSHQTFPKWITTKNDPRYCIFKMGHCVSKMNHHISNWASLSPKWSTASSKTSHHIYKMSYHKKMSHCISKLSHQI